MRCDPGGRQGKERGKRQTEGGEIKEKKEAV
jgi:hypothetical protein